MTHRKVAVLAVVAVLVAPSGLTARQSILKNGSLESGQGPGAIDPQVADKWTEFGINVERSATVNLVPPGPGHALKAFGDGESSSAGAQQEVPDVAVGRVVNASVQLHTPGNDKLIGSGRAGLVLEFLDMWGGRIGLKHEVYVLDAVSPSDTWIPATLGPLMAPSGTVKVRFACRLEWTPGNIWGAAYWDDAQLTVDGGLNRLLNGDFETAGPSPGQSAYGIDDWIGFEDQEKSSAVAKDGLASLKLGTRKAYSGLWQNTRALQDGDHLYLQAYAWNPAADPLTGNSRAGIKLEFAVDGTAPPPEENLAFNQTSPADTWTLVALDTTVPPDVTIARVVCIFSSTVATAGTVHFDAAYAERGSHAGANQLLNASFEFGPGGAGGLDYWTEFGSATATTRKSCFVVPAYDEFCTARATGPAPTGVYQEIPVTAGESLALQAYLYTPSTDRLTGPGTAGVKVEWVLGTVPPLVDIGGPNNTIDAGAPMDQWLPLYIDHFMPPGSNAIPRFVNIIEKGNALTGKLYFDACETVVLNRFDGCDSDGDDDEDLLDFAQFQRCYSGAGGSPLKWNCIVFDWDDNQDIDWTDFGYFAPRMTGPQ